MKLTKENVIDMAWKVTGLESVMKENKDPDAVMLENVQLVSRVSLDIGIAFGGNPTQEDLKMLFDKMNFYAKKYNYDSGRTKYNSLEEKK